MSNTGESKLRERIFNIITEMMNKNNKEVSDYSMFDIAGQLNLPDDLDYKPSLKDIGDIKDEFGDFNYQPMGDEEKQQLFSRINNAKLRKPEDEEELRNIQASLDSEEKVAGGVNGKRMRKMGFDIN